MRISDWSSDVCSSDLIFDLQIASGLQIRAPRRSLEDDIAAAVPTGAHRTADDDLATAQLGKAANFLRHHLDERAEVHTSELQSLMRISYAVFCVNKKQYKIV